MSWPAAIERMAEPTPEWMQYATCWVEDIPPDVFFPVDGDGVVLPKSICARCPVRKACLEYALANGERHGIWGGKSERERRRIRRDRRVRATA